MMKQPSVLTIDLEAYRSNLEFFKRLAPNSELCAVVKANAYGHGLIPCAQAAIQAGASRLGFVDNAEAATLRDAGITVPLVRLRPAILEEAQVAAKYDVEESIGDVSAARLFADWGRERRKPVVCHLKLDVGMGRAGVDLISHPEHGRQIIEMEGLEVVGLMTHFPCSDEINESFTLRQLSRFQEFLNQLKPVCGDRIVCHTANSAACLRFSETRLDMIRPGIASYGLEPGPSCPLPQELRPVMSWHTFLAQCREMCTGSTVGYGSTYTLPEAKRIGTLPVGYANGYDRRLGGRACVLIRGRRCPVLGRISMDMVSVDLTPVPDAVVGDEVVLLGAQGQDEINASEMAGWMDTITYEIVTNLGRSAYQNQVCYLPSPQT